MENAIVKSSVDTMMERLDYFERYAEKVSKAGNIPERYKGKPSDCMVAIEMADRMGIHYMPIMQNMYVVHGAPAFEAKFMIAVINSSGLFSRLLFNVYGTKGQDNYGRQCVATELSTGALLEGPPVTMAMAKAEGWIKNPKWKNIPGNMLMYRAASFWAKVFAPEIIMGMSTPEEVLDASEPAKAVKIEQTSVSSLEKFKDELGAVEGEIEEADIADVVEPTEYTQREVY